jgi:hypothetical protein
MGKELFGDISYRSSPDSLSKDIEATYFPPLVQLMEAQQKEEVIVGGRL